MNGSHRVHRAIKAEWFAGRRILQFHKLSRTIIPVLLLLLGPAMRARALDSSVIGFFPKDVTEFAYADLATARTFPWFAQFESQVVPVSFHNFE